MIYYRSEVVSVSLDHMWSVVHGVKAENNDDISFPVVFPFLRTFLLCVFFQNVEDFMFMNSLLISTFLLILFV